jgi:hypothetical protein
MTTLLRCTNQVADIKTAAESLRTMFARMPICAQDMSTSVASSSSGHHPLHCFNLLRHICTRGTGSCAWDVPPDTLVSLAGRCYCTYSRALTPLCMKDRNTRLTLSFRTTQPRRLYLRTCTHDSYCVSGATGHKIRKPSRLERFRRGRFDYFVKPHLWSQLLRILTAGDFHQPRWLQSSTRVWRFTAMAKPNLVTESISTGSTHTTTVGSKP